jgi:hypothetical protein
MNSIQNGDSISIAQYRALLHTGSAGKSASSGASCSARKLKRASPEEDLQRACFEWAELQSKTHPALKYLIHVPNGGARSKGEAGKLKAMGVKPGVPDFILTRANGIWRGLAIELKSEIGRLSFDQKIWLAFYESEGYLTSVCRSLDDFMSLTMAYLQSGNCQNHVEKGW